MKSLPIKNFRNFALSVQGFCLEKLRKFSLFLVFFFNGKMWKFTWDLFLFPLALRNLTRSDHTRCQNRRFSLRTKTRMMLSLQLVARRQKIYFSSSSMSAILEPTMKLNGTENDFSHTSEWLKELFYTEKLFMWGKMFPHFEKILLSPDSRGKGTKVREKVRQ